jgi:hypothetical protein
MESEWGTSACRTPSTGAHDAGKLVSHDSRGVPGDPPGRARGPAEPHRLPTGHASHRRGRDPPQLARQRGRGRAAVLVIDDGGMRSQHTQPNGRLPARERRGSHPNFRSLPVLYGARPHRVATACATPWTLITELRVPPAERRRRVPPAPPTELSARSAGTACAPPSARAPAGVHRALEEQMARAPARSEAHPPDGVSRCGRRASSRSVGGRHRRMPRRREGTAEP